MFSNPLSASLMSEKKMFFWKIAFVRKKGGVECLCCFFSIVKRLFQFHHAQKTVPLLIRERQYFVPWFFSIPLVP